MMIAKVVWKIVKNNQMDFIPFIDLPKLRLHAIMD